MTNIELIEGALRLAGVLAETDPASAEQGANGLRALNDLLAEWEEGGVTLGWLPQTSVNDDFPLNDCVQAVKYNLATQLCAEYGREPSAWMARTAEQGRARLVRDAVLRAYGEVSLRHMPDDEGRYVVPDLTGLN